MKIEFSVQIFGKYISNFMKIRQVEAEFYHADRQTDRQTDRDNEANSSFSRFLRTCTTSKLPSTLFKVLGLNEGGIEYFGWYNRHLFSESNPRPPV